MAKKSKEKKISYPNYESEGKGSVAKFFNKLGEIISPPKSYKPKQKLWK